MFATLRGLNNSLLDNLGRCPKCMRQSFIFMLGLGGLAFLISWTVSSPILLIASKILAVGSAGLWLSHLTAFALRAVRNTNASTGNALTQNVATDLSLRPRRQFIFAFAKGFALATTATVLPIQASFAQASCRCSGSTPKCCYNYAGNYYVCAPRDANCCASANSPYYCPSGQNCYGTTGCR